MNSAANDNASVGIKSFFIFAIGRSGRRVAITSGVSFGVELTWSNGAVTELPVRFPAYFAAVSHAMRAHKVADAASMIAR